VPIRCSSGTFLIYDGWFGGVEANARWPLGDSDYAVILRSELAIARLSVQATTSVSPELTLLLSQDRWGVAIGPVIGTSVLLNRDHAGTNSPISTSAGVAVRTQPFRRTAWPVLHDLTAVFSATHSLGQAAWVDTRHGRASQFAIGGTLSWHVAW
jgi:hypothetical protein